MTEQEQTPTETPTVNPSARHARNLINRPTDTPEAAKAVLREAVDILRHTTERRPYTDGSGTIDFYPETLRRPWPAHDPTYDRFIESIRARRLTTTPRAIREYGERQSVSRAEDLEERTRYLETLIRLAEVAADILDRYPETEITGEAETLIDSLPYLIRLEIRWNDREIEKFRAFDPATGVDRPIETLLRAYPDLLKDFSALIEAGEIRYSPQGYDVVRFNMRGFSCFLRDHGFDQWAEISKSLSFNGELIRNPKDFANQSTPSHRHGGEGDYPAIKRIAKENRSETP